MEDVPAMAAIRALDWESQEYWELRIAGYLRGSHSPQQALRERTAFVAVDADRVVGFVAGHRTRRYGCDAELQWVDVIADHRGQGIAGRLLEALGGWFVEMDALRVCVDVQPKNEVARRLYARHGAVPLNPHWMVWEDARVMGSGLRPNA
jgi:GNAT superfamily N-acetyltransferase